jgi:hypothetical protein
MNAMKAGTAWVCGETGDRRGKRPKIENENDGGGEAMNGRQEFS